MEELRRQEASQRMRDGGDEDDGTSASGETVKERVLPLRLERCSGGDDGEGPSEKQRPLGSGGCQAC